MLYLKSYCYSSHELPFIIANLEEGFDYIDKLLLYEYNYTHTGLKKEYYIEKLLDKIPEKLKTKLYYKTVILDNYIEYALNNEEVIHKINEPIQRSWAFNDPNINFNDDDIIIDIDIDEIIYKKSYTLLIEELKQKNIPLSIKLNQFFYKNTYLWEDCNFSSPTIYKYSMVKNKPKNIKGLKICNKRDLNKLTDNIYGCHMSWIMPTDYMIKKLYSYSHPKYRIFSDIDVLNKAINEKKYIFDKDISFKIDQLELNDIRIPKYLQKENIFEYL